MKRSCHADDGGVFLRPASWRKQVAGLPLHLYHYKENGGKEKAINHPLYLLLHDEPNPEMSSFVFPGDAHDPSFCCGGNAYAQIIRNGKGEVIAPLSADAGPDDGESWTAMGQLLLRIHRQHG